MKSTRKLVAAGLLLALSTVTVSFAANNPATAPADLGPQVDQLLRQIASEEFAIRVQAQKDLDALPAQALPLLKAALEKCTDEELRTRLSTAVAKVAEKAAVIPTLVSVDLHETAAGKAVAALAPKLFMYVEGGGKAVPPVTFKAEGVPLLRAIADLSKQMPMTLTAQRTSGFAFHIGEAGVFQPSADGLLLVYGGGVIRTRTSPLQVEPAAEAAELWQLSLKIAIDPKLKLFARFPRVVIDNALDDEGHAFTAATSKTDGIDGGEHSGVEARLTLTAPEKRGKKIAILKGHATFYVITASETLGVQAKKNLAFDLHGRKLTADWKPADDIMHLEISGRLPAGLDDPSFSLMDGGPPQIIYATADGKETARNTDSMAAYTKDTWIRDFVIDKNPLPELVQFSVLSQVVAITVPFEFKDLPMP